MATGTSLDYTISGRQTFKPIEGTMDSIKQKNSAGFLVDSSGSRNFAFQLKLKKSVISTIQVCPMFVDRIMFQLFGEKGVSHGAITKKCNPQQTVPIILYFEESQKRKKQTIRIKVELMNMLNRQEALLFGIKYLLVRGQKCQPQKLTYKNISSKPKQKDQFFSDPKLSPHHNSLLKPTVFSQRKKNKSQQIEIVINQSKEDEQLRKVIEMSKHQQQQRLKGNHSRPKQESIIKEQYSNSISNKPREYTKVDYDKVKDIFKYVNATWVQAQRKIEREKNVIQSERLSNAIEVQIFFLKKICIDIPDPAKKDELSKLCRSLGATIKQQPQNYCLLITNRTDTEKVNKSRKLTGVKILKPEFVYDCKSTHAYLSEKDYFHKF